VTITGLAGPAAWRRNRYFGGKTGGAAKPPAAENSVYFGMLTGAHVATTGFAEGHLPVQANDGTPEKANLKDRRCQTASPW
jgi:hypothetical protein